MRLHRLSREDVAAIVATGRISGFDPEGRPIYEGRVRDGRAVQIVTALDASDFVITVFGEVS
jgi:hypothetical protein